MDSEVKTPVEGKKTKTTTPRAKKIITPESVNSPSGVTPRWSKNWLPTLLVISIGLNILLLTTNTWGHTSGEKSAQYNSHTEHDPKTMTLTDMGQMLYGKEWDDLNKSFLEWMIPHHEAAIEMAQALERSNKPELINLGRNIITVQTAEIAQMKKWLKEWKYEDMDIPPTKPTQELY